jgi:hypothetical protein
MVGVTQIPYTSYTYEASLTLQLQPTSVPPQSQHTQILGQLILYMSMLGGIGFLVRYLLGVDVGEKRMWKMKSLWLYF